MFGNEALTKAIETTGIGLEQFAAQSGISVAYLSRLRAGTSIPSYPICCQLSAALGIARAVVLSWWYNADGSKKRAITA